MSITKSECVCIFVALIHTVGIMEPQTRMSELSRRKSIVMALRAGRKPPEIIRMLRLRRRTVYRVTKAFSDAEDIEEGSYNGTRKSHVRRRTERLWIAKHCGCHSSTNLVESSHLGPRIGRRIQSQLWYDAQCDTPEPGVQDLSEESPGSREKNDIAMNGWEGLIVVYSLYDKLSEGRS